MLVVSAVIFISVVDIVLLVIVIIIPGSISCIASKLLLGGHISLWFTFVRLSMLIHHFTVFISLAFSCLSRGEGACELLNTVPYMNGMIESVPAN